MVYTLIKSGEPIKKRSTISKHPDELSEVGKAAYQLVKEEYELQKDVPNELAMAASASSKAHTAWLKARKEKIFLYLKTLFLKTFA